MKKSNSIKILNVISNEHLYHVRNLINAFLKWHLNRHVEDIALINEYFDPRDFEKELASLPGKYQCQMEVCYWPFIMISQPAV
jgi:hypothetical protein